MAHSTRACAASLERPALLGLLAVLLTACSPPSGENLVLAERLIEDDPAETFRADAVRETRTRFRWNLDEPSEASRWSGIGAAARPTGRGIPFAGHSGPAMLVRELESGLEASAVQHLEVRANGLGDAPLTLLWARRGEELAAKRSLAAKATPGNPVSFSFDVESAPEWSGRIEKLALASPAAPHTGGRGRKVFATARRLDEESLRRALLHPWKVDLGGDVRNAFLVPSGTPVVREVELEPGSRLRFGIGASGAITAPILFRASLQEDGSERRVLSEKRLSPRQAGAWSEVEVDLTAIRSKRLTRLLFETETDAPHDPAGAMPVLADPRIVRPAGVRNPQGVNVVLISVDTLRADRLSLAGYPRLTTPRLDRWAEDSAVVFENAIAQAPWTLPSHVSMLTGLDALRHGVNYLDPAPADLELVTESFRRAGYATAGFTAGGFVAAEFGFAQGFDRYDTRSTEAPLGLEKLFDTELEVGVEQVERWLRHDATRPFFLFFHTYEVHSPYHARQPWFDRFGGTARKLPRGFPETRTLAPEPETLITRKRFVHPSASDGGGDSRPLTASGLADVDRMYDSGVAFMDQQIGKLLDLLQEIELDRSTVVVFTSDHGEALGEHRLASHTHLFDETIRVPLIIGLPEGRHGGRRVQNQVRSIDIVPTLLELAGLPLPADLDGTSLGPLLEGRTDPRRRVAWSYAGSTNVGVALRWGNRLKYIRPNAAWPGLVGTSEVYDLVSDPQEQRNLAATHVDAGRLEARTRERLRRDLSGVRLRLSNRSAGPVSGEIGGAVIRATGVSSPDLACRCVEWLGGGRIRYRIPPGTAYTLVLEHAAQGPLTIEGQLRQGGSRPSTFAFRVDLDALAEPTAYGWDGKDWALRETTEPMSTGFVIEGETAVRSTGSPQEKPEVLEQLRALGYVE